MSEFVFSSHLCNIIVSKDVKSHKSDIHLCWRQINSTVQQTQFCSANLYV